jgi:hypothetical protein
MNRVVEPGLFELRVGPSSAQTSLVTLAVTGTRGETGLAPLPPAPAGSQAPLVSDFDDLTTRTSYGSWSVTSDSLAGGRSKAALDAVSGGAESSNGALRVSGEVVSGVQWPWAGVLFTPSGSPTEPANLSAKKEIAFWAKGDGRTYSVAVMTEARAGGPPAMQTVTFDGEWKHYAFPLAAFETDGRDLTAIGFVRTQEAGAFEFRLDRLELR